MGFLGTCSRSLQLGTRCLRFWLVVFRWIHHESNHPLLQDLFGLDSVMRKWLSVKDWDVKWKWWIENEWNEGKLRLCLLAWYDSFRLSKITHLAVDRRWTHGPALKCLTYSHAISGECHDVQKKRAGEGGKGAMCFDWNIFHTHSTQDHGPSTVFPFFDLRTYPFSANMDATHHFVSCSHWYPWMFPVDARITSKPFSESVMKHCVKLLSRRQRLEFFDEFSARSIFVTGNVNHMGKKVTGGWRFLKLKEDKFHHHFFIYSISYFTDLACSYPAWQTINGC